MKKRRYLMIGVVVYIMICLAGCGHEKYVIKERMIEDETNQIQGVFLCVNVNGRTYQFEKETFDKEDVNTYIDKMEAVRERAESYLTKEARENISVVLMGQTPYTGTYVKDSCLYCTKNDLEHDNYKEWYIEACYNINQPFIAVGIAQNSSEEGASRMNLQAHYDNSEDLSELVLFGGCFVKELCYEEDYEISRATASSFVDYLIKNKGTDYLLKEKIGADDKQEWLRSIGVNRTYDENAERALKNANYSKSPKGVMQVQIDKSIFDLNCTESAEDAKIMQQLITLEIEARQLAEKLTDQYCSEKKQELPLMHYVFSSFDDERDNVQFDISNKSVYLEVQSSNLHYYRLFYSLQQYVEIRKCWRERVYSYWKAIFSMDNCEVGYRRDYQKKLNDYIIGANRGDKACEMYLKMDRDYMENREFDIRTYYDAEASVIYNKKVIFAGDLVTTWSDLQIWEIHRINHKEATAEEKITINQYISFGCYIVEQYGEEVLERHLLGRESFDDLTGKSMVQLLSEWRSYLRSKLE